METRSSKVRKHLSSTITWVFDDITEKTAPTKLGDLCHKWKDSMSESHCGISIPEEWVPLVHCTLTSLVTVCPGFKIEQVKEKFGGLRIYVSFPPETDRAVTFTCHLVIDWAENAVIKAEKAVESEDSNE